MKRLLGWLAIASVTFSLGLAAARLTTAGWKRRSQLQNIESQSKTTRKSEDAQTGAPEENMIVEGRYANFDYAYSVLVPKGMIGVGSPAPNPNHGFGINLINPTSMSGTGPKARLWVDAIYNSMEYGSPDDEMRSCLDWIREKHSKVRLISRAATRLGRMRAVRFVVAYEESGEAMIENRVIAFRNQLGEDSDIIYSVDLITPVSRYPLDKKSALEVQQSWLVDPLPNDYPLPPVYEESK
jgi:hypothetical protein